MADVSTIRHTGRPRPLGEVKDDSSYMQLSHRTSIHATGNGINKDNIITQKVNEMRDSLRTATLINIVAAVNGSNNVESSPKLINDSAVSSSTEGLGNTMAVISNLVLTKDRDISIPRPQVFLEAPKKISVKKPVFYKNSQDEVSQNNVERRKRAVSLTRTRTTIIEEKNVKQERPKSENIQIAVSLQQVREDIKAQRTSKDWIDTPAKVRIARSMSPRRRLISVNKKGDSRGSTVLSKCEAVDILDTSDNIQPPTSAKEVKTTDTASQEPKLYRARSLPALFPVKRKKDLSVESKTTNNIEKPKIIAPFKYPSVRAYGGMPNILCGKTMQVRNETFTDISIPVEKDITEKSTDTIIYQQEVQNKQEKYTLSKNYIDGSDIKLDGRSIQNPNLIISTETQQKRDRLLHKRATELDSKLLLMQDRLLSHNNHYEDLQKTMLLKDISCTDSVSENSVDIANYGLIGKGFKSSLSSARSRADKMQKGPRKVTFAEKNEDDILASGETKRLSKNLYEEKIRKLRFLPKRPVSPSRNAFSPVKAKSCGEETRIKRRILPGYYIQEKPKYDVLVNMKISSASIKSKTNHQPRPPSRFSDVRSAVSDTSSYFDDLVHDWNGKEIDATDRTCTNQPVSYGTSSFYTEQNAINIDLNQNDDESYDEDEDYGNDDVNNYRIVKAVDLETLSGFQHRKFKKPTMKREPTATAHFIKIKVKS